MRFPWRRDAVEAALALDDSALAARAPASSSSSPATGISPPRAGSRSDHGLATGGAEGLELLERGVAPSSASPARLDHVRALVDLGAALRRAGRRAHAREPLSRRSKQPTRAAQTRSPPARTSSCWPPERDRAAQSSPEHNALTASERRVAILGAQAQSNRQIAAALYITVRTVENHLASCYRKLGISSRHDLPGALAADRRRAPTRPAPGPAPTPAPAPASQSSRRPGAHPR